MVNILTKNRINKNINIAISVIFINFSMRAVQGENDEYIHYDVHNLYGFSQSKPTLEYILK